MFFKRFLFAVTLSQVIYHLAWAKETKYSAKDGAAPSYEIVRYNRTDAKPATVLLRVQNVGEPAVGAVFEVFRQLGEEKIQTGALKVLKADKGYAVAEVVMDGTIESENFFPKFKGVMIGDVAEPKEVKVVQTQFVTPIKTVHYHEIFRDPKANPSSYELTEEGKQRLKEAAEVFSEARVPVLMIEAYTDQKGPAEVNQLESYQRALTIRQYLTEVLGFDPDRTIALGYGESELAEDSFAPGFESKNRRIVFKAKDNDDLENFPY
jgi:hypothetical protein